MLALFAVGIGPRQSFAQDAQAQALELSDHAFAMLNAINASSAKPGPILAPAASLAGDAQTLSTALGAHDKASASGAMTSILSDRDRIEAAAKIAGGQYPEQWTSIREKIAALEKQVPASKGPVARSEVPESHASVAPPAGEKMPDAPKVEIASRVFQAGKVRVKGFLEGTDLKSAGNFRRRHEEQGYRRREHARRAASQFRFLDRAAVADAVDSRRRRLRARGAGDGHAGSRRQSAR